MSAGRTFVVILFFWALLVIITPKLIQMSASAKPYLDFHGKKTEAMKSEKGTGTLPRRALAAKAHTSVPAPAPAPASTFDAEFRIEQLVKL